MFSNLFKKAPDLLPITAAQVVLQKGQYYVKYIREDSADWSYVTTVNAHELGVSEELKVFSSFNAAQYEADVLVGKSSSEVVVYQVTAS